MLVWALSFWFLSTRWIDHVYRLDLSVEGDLLGFEEENKIDDLVTVGMIFSVFIAIIPEILLLNFLGWI